MNTNDKNQQERLWSASLNGDCAEIRRAILSGAVIEARDGNGLTALNIATQGGHGDAVRTLLAARQLELLDRAGLKGGFGDEPAYEEPQRRTA